MAKSRKIESIQLELSQEEAQFLEALLLKAVDWDQIPLAQSIQDALDDVTEGCVELVFNEKLQLFEIQE